MFVKVLPLTLAIIGCSHAPAQTPKTAQEPKPKKELKLPPIVPNPKLTIAQNSAQFLVNADLQAAIGLSAETRNIVRGIYDAYDAKYKSLTEGKTEGTDELAAKLDAAMVEAADKAVAVLSAPELSRLKQLGVQAMGFEALRMPEVRTGLSLTPDQISQLDRLFVDVDQKQTALDAELGTRLSKIPDPGPKATDEETAAYKKAVEAVEKELDPQHAELEKAKKAGWDALFSSLSPDQKEHWRGIRGT